jgi:ferredoxin
MAPVEARAGISIADAPGRNHCLECGDCVRACEWIIELRGKDPVPLRLGHFRGEQRREASLQEGVLCATSAAQGDAGVSGSHAIRKAS